MYSRLAAVHPSILHLQNFRLDISTPFRTLTEIHIRTKGEYCHLEYKVIKVLTAEVGDFHNDFHQFLESAIKVIKQTQVSSKSGIAFQDLEMIARLFHRKRDEQPGWDSEWERKEQGGGEWIAPEPPPSPKVMIRTYKSRGQGLRRTSPSRTLLAVDLSGGQGFGV